MVHAVLRLFGDFSSRYLLWPITIFVHSFESQQDFTNESQTANIENQMFARSMTRDDVGVETKSESQYYLKP